MNDKRFDELAVKEAAGTISGAEMAELDHLTAERRPPLPPEAVAATNAARASLKRLVKRLEDMRECESTAAAAAVTLGESKPARVMHVDWDCHPPQYWPPERRRAARLRYLDRQIPAVDLELRALQAERERLTDEVCAQALDSLAKDAQ